MTMDDTPDEWRNFIAVCAQSYWNIIEMSLFEQPSPGAKLQWAGSKDMRERWERRKRGEATAEEQLRDADILWNALEPTGLVDEIGGAEYCRLFGDPHGLYVDSPAPANPADSGNLVADLA